MFRAFIYYSVKPPLVPLQLLCWSPKMSFERALFCLEKPSKSLKTECLSDLQVSPSGFSRPFLKPFQHRLHCVMSCAET